MYFASSEIRNHIPDCLTNTNEYWPIYLDYEHYIQKHRKHDTIWATTWQNQQNECTPSKDSDQPGHPPSLIRVFAVRSMGSEGPQLSSCGQQRLGSDWADAQADLSRRWACTQISSVILLQKLNWVSLRVIYPLEVSITCSVPVKTTTIYEWKQSLQIWLFPFIYIEQVWINWDQIYFSDFRLGNQYII